MFSLHATNSEKQKGNIRHYIRLRTIVTLSLPVNIDLRISPDLHRWITIQGNRPNQATNLAESWKRLAVLARNKCLTTVQVLILHAHLFNWNLSDHMDIINTVSASSLPAAQTKTKHPSKGGTNYCCMSSAVYT